MADLRLILLLQPLPFGVTQDFYPNMKPDERVAVYAMLGGVPAYWEHFKPQKSISDNIRSEFLSFQFLHCTMNPGCS